jgi:hypothetical protein
MSLLFSAARMQGGCVVGVTDPMRKVIQPVEDRLIAFF